MTTETTRPTKQMSRMHRKEFSGVINFSLIAMLGGLGFYSLGLYRENEHGAEYARAMGDPTTGFVHVNSQFDVIEWSAGAEKITGYKHAEVFGMSLDLLMPRSRREQHRQRFSAAVQDWPAKTQHVNCEILSKDGKLVAVNISLWKLSSDSYCGIMRGR